MIDPWTSTHVPVLIRDRRWWIVPLLIWGLAVAVSLQQHLEDIRKQSLDVAGEGARNLFNMVVLMRAWNAGHGGVYVPVTDKSPPNPYLKHPRRDLVTRDGQRLTMINPAFMTRQIAELAHAKGGTVFHITSLRPIRPANAPDAWEREALMGFERGSPEYIALQPDARGSPWLRYMAPLRVTPACMICHEQQGYQVGDVRGGISVSMPFEAIQAASLPMREQSWYRHLGTFLAIGLLGGALLELLRRRWLDLAENLSALEHARNAMQIANDELSRARDAAETASRSKSAFLNAMSHELRTPLNGILGFAHLLQRSDLPGKGNEQVRRIADQGTQLLGLVNEVMDYTRLESLEPPARQGELTPAPLLAGLADEFRQAGSARGLRVRTDIAGDLPARLLGEGEWLRGCLRPLLDNAVKFTEQGEVGLSAKGEMLDGGGYLLHVTVRDSGIGIAAADHDKLFQPFRQVDASTTRRHGGLGLGLALSARYANLLGATLKVSSELGTGTRFHVEWRTRLAIAGSIGSEPASRDASAILDELEHLLHQDDVGAAAVLHRALPLLAQSVDSDALARLQREVSTFDYAAALEHFTSLRTRL